MDEGWKIHVSMIAGGLLFGAGLSISNMAQPEVVIEFLNLNDLGLLFVMFGAATVTGLGFHTLPRIMDESLLTGEKLGKRIKTMDRKVVIGGAIFGVGWGVAGVCPGAGYASLGIGNLPVLWSILGMFTGAYAQTYLRRFMR